MKRISLILLSLLVCLAVLARQPERGYRGFLDWNNSLTSYAYMYTPEAHRLTAYYSGISTSHGYQITPVWFVGAGLSVEHSRNVGEYIIPVFLQGRADLKLGKLTPFADIKAGYNLTDGGGAYLSPMIGYRFNWGRKLGINLGLGATLKNIGVQTYEMTVVPGESFEIKSTGIERRWRGYFSFRLGIDF
ncbi:MAG: hypothetical protein K2H94_05275 [Duncaniella sp.]|nr:hypothetical protein [Duncaniella sp.]